MDETAIVERLAKVEERAKSNTHQIEEIKPIVEEIHTLSKTMVELISECKHTNESVTDLKRDVSKLDDRIGTIEQEPAKSWNNAKRTVFNTILGAIAGAIATGIIAILAMSL